LEAVKKWHPKMYVIYYVKDLFPCRDIIISYRTAILRIVSRSFQISVILVSVENILTL